MHGHNPLDGVSVRLWERIARARHRLLMLDVDGALAPVVLAGAKAPPIPIMRSLLGRIAASPHTSLAIVSCRELPELEALIGEPTAAVMHTREHRKGTVVQTLLSSAPSGTLGVFVGDDVADEEAFHAVHERGFGVRVGNRRTPSIAEGRIQSCHALPEFLEEWLRITERSRHLLSA